MDRFPTRSLPRIPPTVDDVARHERPFDLVLVKSTKNSEFSPRLSTEELTGKDRNLALLLRSNGYSIYYERAIWRDIRKSILTVAF